jgi:hypothetical protein
MPALRLAAAALLSAIALTSLPVPARAAPDPGCPGFGWAEGLGQYLSPTAAFPTDDTKNPNTPDCIFHQWSWEAFVWATALVNGPGGATVPRFMTLQTPDQLLAPTIGPPRMLRLGARSHALRGQPGYTEGAGAIVEADGNMMVSQNGYPVYASVHMNASYFATAKQNLIVTGAYQKGDPNQTFNIGAAVFKATWLRLDPGDQPPAGAYVTQAQVPVLTTRAKPGFVTIEPVPGRFVTTRVALVGLHVVGHTVNHPEFLWGTFEHQLNTPATADNTFAPSASISDPKTYTFYKGGTPYNQVNIAGAPPWTLRLDEKTQKLSPVTNAVLENATGGENNPNGADNIKVVNQQAKGSVGNFPAPQNGFATYTLIGTVWMQAKSYNLNSDQNSAIGSISLANATAETFFQAPKNSPPSAVQNCFTCHNPTSYNFQTPPPAKLASRLVALSHVLAYGSIYAVPNSISGQVTSPGGRPKAK